MLPKPRPGRGFFCGRLLDDVSSATFVRVTLTGLTFAHPMNRFLLSGLTLAAAIPVAVNPSWTALTVAEDAAGKWAGPGTLDAQRQETEPRRGEVDVYEPLKGSV